MKKEVKNNIEKEEVLIREHFEKDVREGHDRMAKYLVKKYHFKTVVGNTERHERTYIFHDGIYKVEGGIVVSGEVERILQNRASAYHVREVANKVRRLTFCDRDDFQVKDLRLTCVENGILNIKTKKLIPHSPDYCFTQKLPVSYRPEFECPKAMDFLKSVIREEELPLLQEWFGFGLYRDYFLKKALIIYGIHDTGKTTLLNMLIALYGKSNISELGLQHVASDRFSKIRMYRKLLNIRDELSADDIRDDSSFKMATGRSPLLAEEKYSQSFGFVNYAKLIFGTNTIPSTKEVVDDAYYSRWHIIMLDKQVQKKDQDPHLLEKITTQEELSGLLNWMLDGLGRLLENESFSYRKTLIETKMLMQRASSPIAAFAMDVLSGNKNGVVTKEQMANAQAKYAQEHGLVIVSKRKLAEKLPMYVSGISQGLSRIKGRMTRVWTGVQISTSAELLAKEPADEAYGLKKGVYSRPSKVMQNRGS